MKKIYPMDDLDGRPVRGRVQRVYGEYYESDHIVLERLELVKVRPHWWSSKKIEVERWNYVNHVPADTTMHASVEDIEADVRTVLTRMWREHEAQLKFWNTPAEPITTPALGVAPWEEA